jgi:hypothetical protein
MILKIDCEVFKLVRAESEQFLFDPNTYLIVDKDSDEAEFIEAPIPFPFTEKNETAKAYTKTFDKKTAQFFDSIKDEKEFMNWFWGTVDDGGEKLTHFRIFEDKYHLKKITDWCDENSIPYYVDKNDWYIKMFIGE